MTNAILNNLLVTVITIVGLFVLVGLGKVSGDVAIPIIAGLAGVHTGNQLAPPTRSPDTSPSQAVGGPPPIRPVQ